MTPPRNPDVRPVLDRIRREPFRPIYTEPDPDESPFLKHRPTPYATGPSGVRCSCGEDFVIGQPWPYRETKAKGGTKKKVRTMRQAWQAFREHWETEWWRWKNPKPPHPDICICRTCKAERKEPPAPSVPAPTTTVIVPTPPGFSETGEVLPNG